jgi:hypothetical protein
MAMNVRPAPRPEMPAAGQTKGFERLCHDDVARMGDLLGRDLSGWTA